MFEVCNNIWNNIFGIVLCRCLSCFYGFFFKKLYVILNVVLFYIFSEKLFLNMFVVLDVILIIFLVLICVVNNDWCVFLKVVFVSKILFCFLIYLVIFFGFILLSNCFVLLNEVILFEDIVGIDVNL